MIPRLIHVGTGRHPVVTVDHFTGDWRRVAAIAARLAPFPHAADTLYPGVRRAITADDVDADAYAEDVLRDAAPFIAGAFDAERFDWIEASFSIVTDPPAALVPEQRAPHHDSVDPNYLAVLHHLNDLPGSGTAFYRHRVTGIERLTAANVALYNSARAVQPPPPGYIADSDAHFERIAVIEARPDRLVLYRGAMLHSGVIPAGMPLTDDPLAGRLTANFFVRMH